MISFDLTQEQRQIRSTVRAFVERELIPREPELQARELAGGPGSLTRQETRALRALARGHGLWGVDTPEEFGGAGLDHVTRGLINEELGRTIAWFSFGGSVPAILYRADDYQREHYLLPALADDLLACFALSEPEAGSDARALRTCARRDGPDWIIDGGKTWITNGNEADLAIVFARTQAEQTGGESGISAFLVDREMGWTSYPIAVMGAQSCARLEFDGVRVPAKNLLGPLNCGLRLAMDTINANRASGLPPRNVGASRRMLEMGVSYARSRTTFGKRLSERENIAAMLAECDVQVRSAQALYLFACWCADDGREFRHEASVAKLAAARVANRVADCVLQVHGAMGYSRELPIERWYRDLRVTRIYEGTDEIQLATIARALLASARCPGGLLLGIDPERLDGTVAMDEYEARMARFTTIDTPYDEILDLFAYGRGHCPVPYSAELGGYYLLLRYADVRDALASWQTFSSSPRVFRPLTGRASTPPIDFDPPGHRPWRELFNQAFNPRTARVAEQRTRAGADAVIDRFAGAGSCDLIAQYAGALPVIALCEIIGFPVDKHEDVRKLTIELFEAAPYPDRALRAFDAFVEFGLAEAMTRRRDPRDDFITRLVQAEIDGRPLTDQEIGTAMVVLLGAGHETTVSALGSLLYEVLSRPDLARGVTSDRALLDHAIDETLRLHPPLFGPFRRVTTPTEVSGRQLALDYSVHMCLGSANRDEEQFGNAADFRADRKLNRHLAFGHGIHTCPGAQTAWMELAVGITTLLRRLPDIGLANPQSAAFAFTGNENLRLKSLRATFTPQRT